MLTEQFLHFGMFQHSWQMIHPAYHFLFTKIHILFPCLRYFSIPWSANWEKYGFNSLVILTRKIDFLISHWVLVIGNSCSKRS